MSIRKNIVELFNQILYSKTKLLTNSSIGDKDVLTHYRNLLSIVANIEQFTLSKTLLLIEEYLRSIDSVREYYNREEANYITIHAAMRKSLLEEVSILKIQGASSICSRLLFLMASLNPLISYRIDCSKYYVNLHNILSMTAPPGASEAKIIDLVTSSDTVSIIPGNIYSTWVLETLVNELLVNQINVEILVCRENYDLNISMKGIQRLLREIVDKKEIVLNEIDCLKKYSYRESDYMIISNNLAIYSILDDIDKFKYSSYYLVAFNPINTVLVEKLGIAPVVLSISTLKNILFEIDIK